MSDRSSAGGPSGPPAADTEEDGRPLYCRRLGHAVTFGYCRTGTGDLPCPRVLDCWFGTFGVAGYLRSRYTPEQIARVLRPPREKISQILDIVAAVKRDQAQG